MANLCPSCQAPIRAGAQFCSACRHPLSPAAGATQHIKPGTGPSLIIQEQGSAARQQPLIQFPVTIGREQAPGSILVAHPTVSRQHARIEQRGAEYWLVDLGIDQWSTAAGARLPPAKRRRHLSHWRPTGQLGGYHFPIRFSAAADRLDDPSGSTEPVSTPDVHCWP